MRKSAVILVGLLALTGAAHATVEESLAQLQQFSDGFALVASTVTPGVVAIESRQNVNTEEKGENPFEGTPFEDFFQYRHPGGPQQPREGQGSGVIVNYKGKYYILTNYHVVRGADELEVKLEDGKDFAAEVVGKDSLSDVAVLKVDAQTLPAVIMGNSDRLRVGEWVMAIGNPFGFEHSVTTGIISALGRDRRLRTRRDSQEYGSFIQTDAAINPGNSGGALVNLRGELVGINTAIITNSGGYQGIGFAIPVNLVKNVMEQLIEHGEVRRGLLGVSIDNLDRVTAEALGLQKTEGVLIQKVVPGGAAEKAGVKQGDVVLEVDGKPVRNVVELKSQIGETPPGTRVDLLVVRGEEQRHFGVVLDQLTAEALAKGNSPAADEEDGQADRLGLAVKTLTPQTAEHLGYEGQSGVVVVGVQPNSPAARRGLQRGDLIQEVNRRPVSNTGEYEQALAAAAKRSKSVLFNVRRGESTNLVAVPIPAQ
ncbi:MAG: Do family serine endopeptidase [Candidatus Latescibacteria bacterium]|nr:Do family serine endopeptidase [Candidatus Latescibacterota bacterium]